VINRGFRYKLIPTQEQNSLFLQFSGVCRLIYNLALEQRRDHWRAYQRIHEKKLNYFAQARELTALRAEFDWIAAVCQTCEQQALRDLDKAFKNFFSGRSGYPSPRKKGVNDTFRFLGREVEIKKMNGKWSAVWLPKIGWVKFRNTRSMRGKIKNVSVTLDSNGWHASFVCEIEHVAPANICPSVGIDRGVANTLTLSTGEMLSIPRSIYILERKRRRVQKIVARKKRGSQRRIKATRRVSQLSARITRIRRDWQHKVALNIAKRFGAVVLEDLNIKNMTASAKGTLTAPGRNVRQKAGLNRSIRNQGWGGFETILAYKLEERGGTLISIDPAYTSQTWSECGTVDSMSRESQALFSCRHCGFRAHADHNAAINILRRNTASMRTEEGRWLSDEVRTGRMAIHPENPLAGALGRC